MAEGKRVRLRRVVLDGKVLPKPLQRAFWTRIEHEVQLDVGFTDQFDLREAINAQGDQEAVADLIVTDRFLMSPQAVLDLFDTCKQIVDDLRKIGALPPEGPERH